MYLSSSPSPSSSSPSRPLLVWVTIVVSSWLIPALAQATPPGVVTGVTTGINNSTGERPSRVNINDLYDEAGPHWDLYIQALDMFQRVDMTDTNSYYQITGIHGLPFLPWNGVNQTSGGANSGYCPHGQILAGHVRKAAKQYPVETIDTYTAAAQTFRIPYWDWAQDATLPTAVISQTVNFNSPSGPSTMRNPLYSFQFPNFPFKSSNGGFGGSLAQFNETKRCTLVSGPTAGTSDMILADTVLTSDGAQLQDKVYAVFTQSTTFEAMATMSNAGASFEEPHNVVHDDIACFSVAGHSGHMGDLNWSGFDPVFMLHHANVDRLYAMWQAINYNDPVFTTTQYGNALYGTAAGPVTADSPLRPFYSSSSSTGSVFHTSRSVESLVSFGYTYPEIDDWSLAPADLANSVRVAVNNLYGPPAVTSSVTNKKREAASTETASDRFSWKLPSFRRSWRREVPYVGGASGPGSRRPTTKAGIAFDRVYGKGKHGTTTTTVTTTATITTTTTAGSTQASPIRNAPVLDTNDYSIEIGVDRSQLLLPCTIELHLLGADNNGSGYSSKPAKIGSTSILSMPQTGTSYSTMPLRRVLVGEATRHMAPAVFNDSDDVLDRLRGLGVVIRTSNGTVVPVANVPSLSMVVQQRSYTPVSADNQFPRYGSVTQYPLTPRDFSV
ncbi:hypothetical protein SEUCBS139899_007926 [Sporothrix eucalyptigena]